MTNVTLSFPNNLPLDFKVQNMNYQIEFSKTNKPTLIMNI